MTVCIVPNYQIHTHTVLKLDSTVWHLLNYYVCLYIDVLVNCHAENDADRGEQLIWKLTAWRGDEGRIGQGNDGELWVHTRVLKLSEAKKKQNFEICIMWWRQRYWRYSENKSVCLWFVRQPAPRVTKSGMAVTDNTETVVAYVSVCLVQHVWCFCCLDMFFVN